MFARITVADLALPAERCCSTAWGGAASRQLRLGLDMEAFVDGSHFDTLSKALATARVGRATVLQGLAVTAIAHIGVRRALEPAAARKSSKQHVKICLCDPTGCRTRTVKKGNREKVIRRHAPCAARGACTGVNPCATPVCIPNCERKVCGSDGCGDQCGTCDTDQVCADGRCAWSCPGGQKNCAGECIPSNQCCTSSDCPAATPDCCGGVCVDAATDARNCGGCGTRCSGDRACIGGICEGACASYGASACATPSTDCGGSIVTCGGNPNCYALPTTSGCCACASSAVGSRQACTRNQDCDNAARCDRFGIGGNVCIGDRELPCREDADCASLLVCRNGACGGQICMTDADCAEAVGPGTFCMSGEELPCSSGGANVCWTLCSGT